jgi:hypothetical protein
MRASNSFRLVADALQDPGATVEHLAFLAHVDAAEFVKIVGVIVDAAPRLRKDADRLERAEQAQRMADAAMLKQQRDEQDANAAAAARVASVTDAQSLADRLEKLENAPAGRRKLA